MAISLSYATMTASNGSEGMPITLSSSYENMADSIDYNLAQASANFNMDTNGRLKYTGLLSLPCFVSAKFSLTRDEGVILGAALYKNGSQITPSIIIDPLSPTILNYAVTLAANDYLELWANIEAGDNVTLIQAQMSVIGASLL